MSDFLDRVLLEAERVDADNVSDTVADAADAVPCDEVLLAQRDRLRRALRGLLHAYPRLQSEYSTHEQQRALRVALVALEECGGV